jgi:hypothetical protein
MKEEDEHSHNSLVTNKDKVPKQYDTIFQSPNSLITKLLNKTKQCNKKQRI